MIGLWYMMETHHMMESHHMMKYCNTTVYSNRKWCESIIWWHCIINLRMKMVSWILLNLDSLSLLKWWALIKSYEQKCTRNPHIWWPSIICLIIYITIIYLTILIENLTLSCLDPHWPAGPCTSNHIEDYDGTSSYDDFPSYDDSPSYDDFPSIQQILIWWVAIILFMIIL